MGGDRGWTGAGCAVPVARATPERIMKTMLLVGLACAGWVLGEAVSTKAAEIIRDHHGVPHIFGETLADAVYGQGYCHAQDNLELLLEEFAAERGVAARVAGKSQLESDVMVRAFGLRALAERCHGEFSAEQRDIIDGYAAGIERYLGEHPELRPEWLGAVTGVDIVGCTKLRQLQQSMSVAKADLGGKSKASREQDLAAADDPGGASNMWALRPERTTDGSTKLLSDPHLPWKGATKWHEVELIVGDRWIYGAIFPGGPGVGIGFTPNVAWGYTNNGADIADVYREELDPANPDRYRYDGGWRAIRSETYRIDARQEDGGMRTVEREVRFTHHGPIMKENRGAHQAFAVHLAGWEEQAETLDWVANFHADSLKDFEAGLDAGHAYKWNCIAADRRGNIGYYYQCAARVRDDTLRWNAPVDGSNPATEWGRYLSWRELPHAMNPKSGYLVNCNNNAYTVTRDCPLKPADFPRNLMSQATELKPDTRAHRAMELIEARPRHDDASFGAIATDLKTLTAQPLVDLVLGAVKKAGARMPDAAGRRAGAVATLKAWDGRATVENRALPILAGFLEAAEDGGVEKREVLLMPTAEVVETLDEGLALLEKRWGTEPITWGRLHVGKRGDREVAMPGAGSERGEDPFSTLFMIGAKQRIGGKYYCDSGSSWIQSVTYRADGRMEAWTVLPFGNSNVPDSPHYNDQMALFANRAMKPALVTREAIEAAEESRVVLERGR